MLTADGGPPHPQQVALAISRAPTRDTQHRERYMASYAQEPITAKPLTHACDTRLYLPCRTLRQMTQHQGRSVCTALRWMRHLPNRVRRLKVGVLPRRRRRQVQDTPAQWPPVGHSDRAAPQPSPYTLGASRRPSRHRRPLQGSLSSSLRRASPRCSAHTTDPATSQSIITRSMATPLQPNSRGWETGTCH